MEKKYIKGLELQEALKVAGQLLEDNKEKINALNVFPVPDGDTGTNMSLTMKSAVKKSSSVESDSIADVMLAASQGSLMGARGNSGVILSQLFRGFALGFKDQENADVEVWAQAFKEAANTAYKAVMKPTEGTILTVAREMGERAEVLRKKEVDVLVFLEKIIEHGNQALAKTQDMLPVLKEAGVVDAGGKGLMTIITGIYNSLSGKEILVETRASEEEDYQDLVDHKDLDVKDIKFAYCTEFMVNGDISDLELEQFRNYLAQLGDSLMAVKGEGLIKVHFHTNNPGKALEKAVDYGYLSDIKIDNMKLQYQAVQEAKKADKKYSFVAVSTGEGIDKIFKDLNVDAIVTGGQTMNPSTEDIVKAIEKTSGENVYILPNNSNIILAAEQSKDLSTRNVIVLPTKTIPQGIAALFSFDESMDLEENQEAMLEAISEVKSGQLTYAVRDSEVAGKKIEKDDYIGMVENKILVSDKDKIQALEELIAQMVDEDSSIITLIYGEDTKEAEAEDFGEKLSDLYSDLDIEVLYGGQPIYSYIISVE